MANVLVLGATGQIGLALTLASLAERHAVTSVTRKTPIKQGVFRVVKLKHKSLDIFKPGNQRDLRELFSQQDIIFHAAEPYPYKQDEVAQAIKGNARVIRTAVQAGFTTTSNSGKRFVRIGSAPAETDHDGNPLSTNPYPGIPYFDAKWAMSREAMGAYRSHDAAVISAVYPVVLGFGSNHGSPKALARFITGRLPLIPSIITNAAPAAHLAEGALLVANKGTPGKTYQLAGMDIDTSEIIKFAMKCADVKGIRRLAPTIKIFPRLLHGAAMAMRGLSRWNLPLELSPTSFALFAGMGSRSSYAAEKEIGYKPPNMTEIFNAINAQVLWYQAAGVI